MKEANNLLNFKTLALLGFILLLGTVFLLSLTLSKSTESNFRTDLQLEEVDSDKLVIDQVRFAAEKIMGNRRILQVTPLILPTGEIQAYEIVFSRKDYINYADFKPYIVNPGQFFQPVDENYLNQIYQLLIKSEITDLNAPVFKDYFYILVISARRDSYPEQFRYKGLPLTYKLKYRAGSNLRTISSQLTIVNGQYLYFKIGYMLFYFETNSGDRYLLSSTGKMTKVASLKSVEFVRSSIDDYGEKEIRARKKWSQLLQGYEGK